MIDFVLRLFGYRIEYVCEWGTYSRRYDCVDRMAGRPIHSSMGVAPPWAKLRIVRNNKEEA